MLAEVCALRVQPSVYFYRLGLLTAWPTYYIHMYIINACDYIPAGSAAGSSAGISFTHGPILGFFAPQGRHVTPIKVKFGMEEGPLFPAKFHLDRFRGGGLRPPKLKKNRILPI